MTITFGLIGSGEGERGGGGGDLETALIALPNSSKFEFPPGLVGIGSLLGEVEIGIGERDRSR